MPKCDFFIELIRSWNKGHTPQHINNVKSAKKSSRSDILSRADKKY